MSNQLAQNNRKKELLNEDILRLRQKLEQCNENNARINRNLEDLVKETEEKQVSKIKKNYLQSLFIIIIWLGPLGDERKRITAFTRTTCILTQ